MKVQRCPHFQKFQLFLSLSLSTALIPPPLLTNLLLLLLPSRFLLASPASSPSAHLFQPCDLFQNLESNFRFIRTFSIFFPNNNNFLFFVFIPDIILIHNRNILNTYYLSLSPFLTEFTPYSYHCYSLCPYEPIFWSFAADDDPYKGREVFVVLKFLAVVILRVFVAESFAPQLPTFPSTPSCICNWLIKYALIYMLLKYACCICI